MGICFKTKYLQLMIILVGFLAGLTACEQPVAFKSLAKGNAPFSSPECSDPVAPQMTGPLDVVAGQPVSYSYNSVTAPTWIFQFPDGERSYQGSPIEIVFDEPGTYQGFVKGADACQEEYSESFVVTAYPALNNLGILIAAGAQYTRNANVELSLSAENASEMYVTFDSSCESGGIWEAYRPQRDWRLRQEGADVRVYVLYRSPAQTSACLSDGITYDKTPPELKFVTVPNATTYTPEAHFVISASDAVSGLSDMYCSIDLGAPEICQPEVFLQNLSYGTHDLKVAVSDRAGNVAPDIQYTWNYVNTPPTVVITAHPEKVSKDDFARFEFTVEDDRGPTSTVCSLDGAEYSACASPMLYSGLANGDHQFTVQAFDGEGLASEPVSYFWKVNHVVIPPPEPVPPVVYLTKTPDVSTYEVDAHFEFRAQASDAGIKKFVCKLDAATEHDCASPTVYSSLEVGQHRFTVYAIDNENLQSESVSYEWEILEKRIPVMDEFVVDSSGKKLDVVVVIDNSASMWEEQRKMADRFGTFVDSLTGLDWQLGIITTDARSGSKAWQDGRLVPFNGLKDTYVVNAQTPDLEKVFESTIRRKETGTSKEEGIHSLLKAFKRSSNRFFFRERSHIASIIVSDEDERSNGKNLKPENTPENLLQNFQTLYGKSNTYSNHSIVLQPDATSTRDCPQVGDFSPGLTYMRLSQMTKGIVGDLCAKDYGVILKGIGDHLQQNAYSVKLQCEPKGDVDVVITPTPSYPVGHTVVGDKLHLQPYPPVGSKVAVTYYCD